MGNTVAQPKTAGLSDTPPWVGAKCMLGNTRLALPCRAEEEEEATSACPFCGAQGPETELDCVQCQNIIPFCIASGEPCQAHSLRLLECWPLHFDWSARHAARCCGCVIFQILSWQPSSTQLKIAVR